MARSRGCLACVLAQVRVLAIGTSLALTLALLYQMISLTLPAQSDPPRALYRFENENGIFRKLQYTELLANRNINITVFETKVQTHNFDVDSDSRKSSVLTSPSNNHGNQDQHGTPGGDPDHADHKHATVISNSSIGDSVVTHHPESTPQHTRSQTLQDTAPKSNAQAVGGIRDSSPIPTIPSVITPNSRPQTSDRRAVYPKELGTLGSIEPRAERAFDSNTVHQAAQVVVLPKTVYSHPKASLSVVTKESESRDQSNRNKPVQYLQQRYQAQQQQVPAADQQAMSTRDREPRVVANPNYHREEQSMQQLQAEQHRVRTQSMQQSRQVYQQEQVSVMQHRAPQQPQDQVPVQQRRAPSLESQRRKPSTLQSQERKVSNLELQQRKTSAPQSQQETQGKSKKKKSPLIASLIASSSQTLPPPGLNFTIPFMGNYHCQSRICLEFLSPVDKAYYDFCLNRAIHKNSNMPLATCHFMDGRARAAVALASFPGSGNTWVRGLLEQATGICTGAIYCDSSLRVEGFGGEAVRSGAVIAVKTHRIEAIWTDINRPNISETGEPRYGAAILVIRNPLDALIAEWNRESAKKVKDLYQNGSTHVRSVGKEFFGENRSWNIFVKTWVKKWRSYFTGWLMDNGGHPVLVVRFEDLKTDLLQEIRRMLKFLEVPYSEEELKKRMMKDNATFRRKHHEQFEHFTAEQRAIVLQAIQQVVQLLKERNGGETLRIEEYLKSSTV